MELFGSDTDDIQQRDRTDLTPHRYYPMVAKVFERLFTIRSLAFSWIIISSLKATRGMPVFVINRFPPNCHILVVPQNLITYFWTIFRYTLVFGFGPQFLEGYLCRGLAIPRGLESLYHNSIPNKNSSHFVQVE